MKLIYRNVESLGVNDESRTISGKAVVFDSWSKDLGGFNEIIKRGSITEDLLFASDIIMNVNHDDDKMLARWNKGNGTLNLELREDGLYFNFDAPPTPLGDELLYNVRSGNLFECSFAFALDPHDESCERWYREDNSIKREINKISGLYDCAICTHGAYAATHCQTRGLDVEKIDVTEKIKALDEAEKRELEEKNQEIMAKLDAMKLEMEKYNSDEE